jgi:serine/threonine protein kinase
MNIPAEVYKNRIFSCLAILPARRMIKEFKLIPELLIALRDTIKAYQSLLSNAKILHQDISENNIIITDPKMAGGFTGMLIDLDLAIVDGERTGGRHMTGTMDFMAIDVLRGVEHTYRYDLESFFYVLLWICARRA